MRKHDLNRSPAKTGVLTAFDAEALLLAAPHITLRAPLRCTPPEALWPLNKLEPFDRLHLLNLSLADSVLSQLYLVTALGAIRTLPVHECIAALADALRQNNTLESLYFDATYTYNCDATMAILLPALISHPSLRVLDLYLVPHTLLNFLRDYSAQRALCALVAADAPALRKLHIQGETLSDVVLSPLLDALALNKHLRVIDFGAHSSISAALAADKLLTAVRGAEALRELVLQVDGDGAQVLVEVQTMLASRAFADVRS
jgi:hypothetical protein